MEPIVKDKNSTKGLDHDKCKVIYFNVYLEVYLKQLEAISEKITYIYVINWSSKFD